MNARQVDELDECLELLHRVIKRVITRPQNVLAEHGLGRAHHRALFYIRRESGIAVGDLAARMVVTTQAVHKTLRDLIDHGLVQSKPNPKNRRARQLTLTKDGAKLEARISGMQRDIFDAVVKKMGRPSMTGWAEVSAALSEA